MTFPLASIFILIALAITLWHWVEMPRPRARHFNLLGVLILLAIGIELYGGFTNAQRLNNTIGYNLFNLVEAYFVLLIIHAIIPKWRTILFVLGITITAAYAIDLAMNEFRAVLLNDAIIFSAMILAGSSMALLWHLAQTGEVSLVRVPEFWLFLGFLIYFAGIVPVIGLQRFVYDADWPTASKLYKIVPALCIIRYLLAAYSCRLAGRTARGKPAWRSASMP